MKMWCVVDDHSYSYMSHVQKVFLNTNFDY